MATSLHRRRSSLVLLLLPLVFSACPKKRKAPQQSKIIISSLEVRDRTLVADRIADLSAEFLKSRVTKRLKKHAHLRLIKSESPMSYRLRIDVGLGRSGGKIHILVAGRARRRSYADDAIVLQASVVAPMSAQASADAKKERILRTLDEVTEDLAYQAGLVVAPPDRLVAALKRRKDQQRLASAVEIAALRKIPQTVPALISLLHSKNRRISDRAIGALAAIGDRRAVKPLTRLAKFRDTARMAKVLDAIGALGGKEARQYLEFVAVGHVDADIKNLASEALQRMKRTHSSSK